MLPESTIINNSQTWEKSAADYGISEELVFVYKEFVLAAWEKEKSASGLFEALYDPFGTSAAAEKNKLNDLMANLNQGMATTEKGKEVLAEIEAEVKRQGKEMPAMFFPKYDPSSPLLKS